MTSLIFALKKQYLKKYLSATEVVAWINSAKLLLSFETATPPGTIHLVFGEKVFDQEFPATDTAFHSTFHVETARGLLKYSAIAAQFYRWADLEYSDAVQLVTQLNSLDRVEYAYLEGKPSLPRVIHRSATPAMAALPPIRNLRRLQHHLADDPFGIGFDTTTLKPTLPLQDPVSGADIEFGWNFRHQEFKCDITPGGVTASGAEQENHGTAAIGLAIAALEPDGSVGIAPFTQEVKCFGILDDPNKGSSVASAVHDVAEMLRPGDVLMIQVQLEKDIGGENRFVPVECEHAVLLAIQFAVQRRGVIVVEPAGNGAVDFDVSLPQLCVDNSGAILVGAGQPPANASAPWTSLSYSNHGARIDVLAHGENVCTTGYGDIDGRSGVTLGSDWYTEKFAGTSSATAIVWGVCLLAQEVARSRPGLVISPAVMRQAIRLSAERLSSTSPPHVVVGCPDLSKLLTNLGL